VRFLDLADQVLEQFRPEVLLTYGGRPASLELMRRTRLRGIAVAFHLHNFRYNDRRTFADAASVIFHRNTRGAITSACSASMGR
jgi:hypothetical protein